MFKVTTWNVNGVRARERDVLAWVERERPDVLCLQEVKASPEHVPATLQTLPGYHCYWHGHKGYSGVALHVSEAAFPVRPIFAHPTFDHETRIVTARAGDLLLASIYVPNGGKDFAAKVTFLDALDAFAHELSSQGVTLILCGDLNVAREPRDVHPTLQKPQQIGQTPGERAQLERLIARDLVDLSRQFHPDDDQLFTWWAPWRNMRQRNIGWRLDYVLCSPQLSALAKSCEVEREFGGSDHGPVTALFDYTPPRASAAGDPPIPLRRAQVSCRCSERHAKLERMVEAGVVLAMLLLIGAFGAVKVVPWDQLLSIGKALMLGSASFGIPLEALYFTALGVALTWSGRRPAGWYWRPFLHHHLLSARQKVWVLPWFLTGALSFVGIVFGIAITVLGMIAAATQSR